MRRILLNETRDAEMAVFADREEHLAAPRAQVGF
jgi:hypothetical protein